jgi:tRNA modification GTPase
VSRASVLTPPGTGAIATVEVRGAAAWDAVRKLFHPAGAALPESPVLHRVWFGRLGDGGDEVVLAVKHAQPETVIEIHCHGGRRVVRLVVERLVALGSEEPKPTGRGPWALLERAPTVRTAAILLEQCHGAFDRAIAGVFTAMDRNDSAAATRQLADLAAFGTAGRHLVEPWKVVVAGAPNVGKSSLVNALAGYQRSVVSAAAGTTRDVVTVPVAFDGWPVVLADTAGLRWAEGSLEAEGVALARRFLAEADLVVWVLDAADRNPVESDDDPTLPRVPFVLAANKTDLPAAWDVAARGAVPVSAATGSGISELISGITAILVPTPPPPGAGVPYTPILADAIDSALTAVRVGNDVVARRFLESCLTPPR